MTFPTFQYISQMNFCRDPFLIRIDQETDKRYRSGKLLQKHSEKGRQDHQISPPELPRPSYEH